MLVGDLDPIGLRVFGALLGGGFGSGASFLADVLPRRYGIDELVTDTQRRRRRLALVLLSAALSAGIAHVLARGTSARVPETLAQLVVHGSLGALVLGAAAIDLEHMILPDEITIGGTLLGLLSSPLRSVGPSQAVLGAVTGFAVAWLPLLLYQKIRGRSGMGLGDTKLAILAGAWLGPEGALFVLFAGALQSAIFAIVARPLGFVYVVPKSVLRELSDLRASAAAGDEEAKAALRADPMASEVSSGALSMRLPLGPFLALACVEVLFLRRWLIEHVVGWLGR